TMTTINLNDLELNEFIGKHRPAQHCRATFPMFRAHGTKALATVYFEIGPGDSLGRHADSAEERLLILEGEAEVIIDDEKIRAMSRTLALVPAMVPHDVVNVGSGMLKVLGVFGGASDIVATFDHAWLPS